jgi:tetratricopeptide (TPR) repeat protein
MTDYYYYKKYLDSAAYGYRKLIEIVPNDPNVYFFYVTALQENGKFNDGLLYCDSLILKKPDWHLPHQAKSYLYLNARDSASAVTEIEKGFQKGWRDNQMLDVMGMYWWTRDKKKWEELKKYLN